MAKQVISKDTLRYRLTSAQTKNNKQGSLFFLFILRSTENFFQSSQGLHCCETYEQKEDVNVFRSAT